MVYTCPNCGIVRGGGIAPAGKIWDQCRCGATDVDARPCVEGMPGELGVPGEHPKKVYRGFLRVDSHGDSDDILFLDEKRGEESERILAEALKDDMGEHGHHLTVRYFTADEEMSIDGLTETFVKIVSGIPDIEYSVKYSEITGYLWTDEDIKVGGHDLLEELKSEKGRFCHLEVEFVGGEKGTNED